ncbi:MAG: TIR domain-containing protein [Acidobacteriia bacterium]|nr:TIR domain-containing protein [Terriglobia bacterium]
MNDPAMEDFDVAFSFAEEDRPVVEDLANQLRERGVKVFYDHFLEADLWGKKLTEELSEIYWKRCKYCVVFLSEIYVEKDWTRLEFSAAQRRAVEQRSEYILPVRLDDVVVPTLLNTVFVDWRKKSASAVDDLICHKLGYQRGSQKTVLPGKDGRMVVELRSDFTAEFGRGNYRRMVNIHNSILELAGLSEARIVGVEEVPHRVQLMLSPVGYSRLRASYLSGKLKAESGVKWTDMIPLEGRDRAPAPSQVPLALLRGIPNTRKWWERRRTVVCHLPGIKGFEKQREQAERCLGLEVTTDVKRVRAFITVKGNCLYIHSNFQKDGCCYPTKIATNLPVNLFVLFINLTTTELTEEDEESLAKLKLIHTKCAEYLVSERAVGIRGDEFYCGAMNVRFI